MTNTNFTARPSTCLPAPFRLKRRAVAGVGHFIQAVFVALSLLIFSTLSFAATIKQPNGSVVDSNEDLRVKVLGGWVAIARSWGVDNVSSGGGKWYFNPAWAELKFTFDSLDGSVKSIRRIDSVYNKGGNGIYLFAKQDFIKAVTAPDPANPTKTIITGWRWYNTTGDWITYNKDGRITAYGDRNNIQVSFELDANGQPTTIKDHNGNLVITFTYTGNKISRITDRTNRQVQYTWVNNALTEVIDVLNNKTLYQYATASVSGPVTVDATGQSPDKNLTIITDPEGRITQFTYTGNRVARMTDPMNNATNYTSTYDKGKRQWTILTEYTGGRRVEVIYNALGEAIKTDVGTRTVRQMVKASTTSEIKIDERGNGTRFDYDSRFNPLKITYPDGSSTSATYDPVYSNPLTTTDEAGVLTTFEYDSKGNRLKMIAAKGTGDEQTTIYTYDTIGQMLTLTRLGRAAGANTPAVSDAATTFTYDTTGNLTSITDGETNRIEFSNFDAIGNAQSIKDARGNTSTITYNAKGWRLTQANALGHTMRTVYDKVGNAIRTTDPSNAITQYTYNKRNELTDITDALGGVIHYDYDAEGRAIKATDPGHDSPTGSTRVITQYAFDPDGRIIKNTDGNGNIVTGTWGNATDGLDGLLKSVQYPTYREDYKFDNRNRKTQTIRVLDASTQYATTSEYDARGNAIVMTDPLNRKAKTDYDSLSRPVKTTNAMNGITQLAYDTRDNLTAVTDANGNPTRYSFDRANRMTKETRPLGEATNYLYDPNGNLTTRTNAKGEGRQYTYDTANRLTEIQYTATNSSTATRTISFTYDANGRRLSYTDSGEAGKSEANSATYVYDAKGQKTQEIITYQIANTATPNNSFSKTLQTTYYPNGLKKTFTYPQTSSGAGAGGTVSYTYDGNAQLKTVTLPNNQVISYDTYNWMVPTSKTMPGVVTTMSYDNFLRPLRIKSQAINGLSASGSITIPGTVQSPTGNVLMDSRYQYNEVGNINKRQTEHGDYQYAYDDLDRLTQAIPPSSAFTSTTGGVTLPNEIYSYDAVHNRKTSVHQPGSWTVNGNNQLTQYGVAGNAANPQVVMSYDANGHTLNKTVTPENPTNTDNANRQYGYNTAERLAQVKDGSNNEIASYAYDPLGRRIRKIASLGEQAGITTFIYASGGLIAEADQSGNITTTYGWMPNGTWGTAPLFKADMGIGSTTSANVYHYYHNDHLGTSQRLTNETGMVTWEGRMEAFGKTTVLASTTTTAMTTNRLRFAGQYEDAETGTYYNYFRDYQACTGRYSQFDPIGLAGGPNAYVYVGGNPLRLVDPSGQAAILIPAVIGAVIGGIAGGIQSRNACSSIIFGIFTGAVAGGAAGAIPAQWGVVAGMLANSFAAGAGNALNQRMGGGPIDLEQVAVQAGIGGISGGLGSLAGTTAGRGFVKANRPASDAARPAIVKAALDQATLAGAFGSGAAQIVPNLVIDTKYGGFVPTEGGGTCR